MIDEYNVPPHTLSITKWSVDPTWIESTPSLMVDEMWVNTVSHTKYIQLV